MILELVIRAAGSAARKGRNHPRKNVGATPYSNHSLALARVLATEGGVTDGATLAAALLDDIIEDTQTSPMELFDAFGDEIADLVCQLSDDDALSEADKQKLQITNAALLNPKAALIQLADKIASLRDMATCPPAGWSVDKRREYFDWAKQVVDRLRGGNPQLETVFDAAYTMRPWRMND